MAGSVWTDHLKTQDEKVEFIKGLRHSRIFVNRLSDIVDKKIAELYRQEVSESYDSPAWAMLQADRIGQLKAYNFLKQLLDLKEDK